MVGDGLREPVPLSRVVEIKEKKKNMARLTRPPKELAESF